MKRKHPRRLKNPIVFKKNDKNAILIIRILGHFAIAGAIYVFPILTHRLLVDHSLYFYFFSTVSQSLAGIFAVLGTYLIFRINSFNSIMEHVESEILQIINDKKYNRLKVYTRTNIPMLYANYVELLTDQGDQIKFVILMNEHKSLEDNKKRVFKKALFPLFYNAFVVLLSITLLPFTSLFIEFPAYGKMVLASVVCFSGWTLFECMFYLFPEKPEETIEIF